MKTYLTFLMWALALASLATAEDAWKPEVIDKNVVREHVIMVHESGAFRDAAQMWGYAPKEDTSCADIEVQLRLIEAKLREQRERTGKAPLIRVYVHGGLNTYRGSKQHFNDVYPEIHRTGGTYDPNCYPIFIVWESGLWSALFEHFIEIRQGEVHRRIGVVTAPVVLATDLAISVARAPLVWGNQIHNYWFSGEIPGGTRDDNYTLVEGVVRDVHPDSFHPGQNKRTNWARFGDVSFFVATFPLKLVTAPFVAGMGTSAWEGMLRHTRTMFEPQPREIDIVDRLGRAPTKYDDAVMAAARAELGLTGKPNLTRDEQEKLGRLFRTKVAQAWIEGLQPGVMFAFSHRLADWSNDARLLPAIELYAHSMGTIVVNRMLQIAPELKSTRILYAGAACSIRDWQKSMLPYLEAQTTKGQCPDFYCITLHRARETGEVNPEFFGLDIDLAPRGSLLDWIDNFFTRPETIYDRTLGSWENLLRTTPEVTKSLWPRVHLMCFDSMTGIYKSGPLYGFHPPQKHADLNNWHFWNIPAYWEAFETLPLSPKTSR